MYNINTFPEKVLIWNSERFLTFFEADLRMCNIAKQAEVSGHTGYFNCYIIYLYAFDCATFITSAVSVQHFPA